MNLYIIKVKNLVIFYLVLRKYKIHCRSMNKQYINVFFFKILYFIISNIYKKLNILSSWLILCNNENIFITFLNSVFYIHKVPKIYFAYSSLISQHIINYFLHFIIYRKNIKCKCFIVYYMIYFYYQSWLI